MLLVKVPGIIAATVGLHWAWTPPTGRPAAQQRASPTFLEKYFLTTPIRIIGITLVWYTALTECAVIVASRIPQSPLTQDVLRVALFKHGDPQRLAPSPIFLAGAALIIGGAYLRDRCYKALGNLFTFERAILPDHKLVTTGPYSVVRHPSYAGMIPVYLGFGMRYSDRNSWLWQSSVLDTQAGRVFFGSFAVVIALTLVSLLARVPKEDATLKEEFGEEWEEWARRVPYALIPGIY
ncbi:hypothetical protein BD779DRAFT_1137936 [Infundibulicybe gibba]|nr:hypothetical protein BD779DRAFT_1137936 [Infundibulicybe gibba]